MVFFQFGRLCEEGYIVLYVKLLMKAKTRQRKDGIMALPLRPLKKSLNPNAKFLQNVFFPFHSFIID